MTSPEVIVCTDSAPDGCTVEIAGRECTPAEVGDRKVYTPGGTAGCFRTQQGEYRTGELEAKVEYLEARVERLEQDAKETLDMIRCMKDGFLMLAKGGAKHADRIAKLEERLCPSMEP